MARYYFDLYNDEVSVDEEGIELSDDEAARDWGRREVLYQAGESVKVHGHLVRSHKVVVRNDSDAEVATITFGEVVAIRD